jgi:hypothetical protein
MYPHPYSCSSILSILLPLLSQDLVIFLKSFTMFHYSFTTFYFHLLLARDPACTWLDLPSGDTWMDRDDWTVSWHDDWVMMWRSKDTCAQATWSSMALSTSHTKNMEMEFPYKYFKSTPHNACGIKNSNLKSKAQNP